LEEAEDVVDGLPGRGCVLHDFETNHQIECAGGRRVVVGVEGIVAEDVFEAQVAERLAGLAGAGAVVENAKVGKSAEHAVNALGVLARTDGYVFGIDENVLVVVDVGGEVLRGEVVESGGEQKTAAGAAMVIDGDAAQAERMLPAIFTVSVEVDDAEQIGGFVTALARDGARGVRSKLAADSEAILTGVPFFIHPGWMKS
jgi:hypothetical protein